MPIGTITIEAREDAGNGLKLFKCSFAGDSAYPTNGSTTAETLLRAAITAAAVGATDKNIRGPEVVDIIDVIPGDCGQYVPSWTYATALLKVRDGGHATWNEVGNGTNLAATTFHVTFICK